MSLSFSVVLIPTFAQSVVLDDKNNIVNIVS